MATKTGIGWTDATWNPLRGCTRVSAGCQHCYAERVADKINHFARAAGRPEPYAGLVKTVGQEPRWTGRVQLVEEALGLPLKWRTPRRVFVNSMSDLFHEAVTSETLDLIMGVMALAPRHTFQVLTKRPERMLAYLTELALNFPERLSSAVGERFGEETEVTLHNILAGASWWRDMEPRGVPLDGQTPLWPLPNVHLGVSVEDQAAADARIPPLLEAPAAVRWVSAEPLLGPVDLRRIRPWHPAHGPGGADALAGGSWGHPAVLRMAPDSPGYCNHSNAPTIDWVVVGGESGSGHRTMDLGWLADIVGQCVCTWVPVFVKQDSGPLSGRQGRIPGVLWGFKDFPRAAGPLPLRRPPTGAQERSSAA